MILRGANANRPASSCGGDQHLEHPLEALALILLDATQSDEVNPVDDDVDVEKPAVEDEGTEPRKLEADRGGRDLVRKQVRAGDHETVPGATEHGVIDQQQNIGGLGSEAETVRAERSAQLAWRDVGCDEDPVATEEGSALRDDWIRDHVAAH